MNSIRALVNGEHRSFNEGTSLVDIVEQYSTTQRGIAVAMNREIVPKSLWATTLVIEQAEIEIVAAAAGG